MSKKEANTKILETLIGPREELPALPFDLKWWNPKEGENIIRILPAAENSDEIGRDIEVANKQLPRPRLLTLLYILDRLQPEVGIQVYGCPHARLRDILLASEVPLTAYEKQERKLAAEKRREEARNSGDYDEEDYEVDYSSYNYLDFQNPYEGNDLTITRSGRLIETKFSYSFSQNRSAVDEQYLNFISQHSLFELF